MSKIKMCTRQVKFNFVVPVTDLFEFNTTEISIDGIPWTIRVRKIAVNARISRSDQQDAVDAASTSINLFLVCNYKTQAENIKWYIEAAAALKLISHNENSKPVEKRFPMMKFDDSQLTSSLENFIPWKELMDEKNHYVKEGKITFEAMIISSPLCQPVVAPVCEVSSTKFGIVLQDVKDLKSTFSSKATLRGIDWKVKFQRTDENYLAIYLHMETKIEHFAWSLVAGVKVKLLSHSKDVQAVEKNFQHRYNVDSCGFGWPKFIDWNEMVKKHSGHVENKDAYFDISINVGPQEPFWKIEESFHVNNQLTSTLKCPICLESFRDKEVLATGCGHLFCADCIRSSIQLHNKCSVCNVPAAAVDLRPIYC